MENEMTASDTAAKIIRDHLDLDPDLITLNPEVTFGEIGADSLDVVEIAMTIEGELDLGDVDVSEHWSFDTTVAQACADVEAAVAKAKVPA